MKKIWFLFFILFLTSIIFVFSYWKVDGFDFFKLQEQEFYFQSWISIAGILFSIVVAISTFVIYKKTKLASLKYIPLSFALIAIANSIIGYHSSYCKVCSDLGFCAASHNYPNYLIIITYVIFVLVVLTISKNLSLLKKAESLKLLLYGLMAATALLLGTSLIGLKYLEIPDNISYVDSVNLQAIVFASPLVAILFAFINFKSHYKPSPIYFLMIALLSLSFLPQIYHVYSCNDCHNMECSEFYVLSGVIMMVVTGLFIHAVHRQLEDNKEET